MSVFRAGLLTKVPDVPFGSTEDPGQAGGHFRRPSGECPLVERLRSVEPVRFYFHFIAE